jgi:hypothetical protein
MTCKQRIKGVKYSTKTNLTPFWYLGGAEEGAIANSRNKAEAGGKRGIFAAQSESSY